MKKPKSPNYFLVCLCCVPLASFAITSEPEYQPKNHTMTGDKAVAKPKSHLSISDEPAFKPTPLNQKIKAKANSPRLKKDKALMKKMPSSSLKISDEPVY